MATLEFGLMLRQNDPDLSLENLLRFDQQCIETVQETFTTLWMEDHPQVGDSNALECLSSLSYFAGAYPRFKIGSLVLSQSYRNPALVAKMAANLQALSGGRFILGLGAGWKEDEYRSYGYPFPPLKIRMEQLEEAVQIIRALWSTQPASFAGKHYQISQAYCLPQPVHNIPLLLGGSGEKYTPALVARYADWYNFNSCTVEEYAHKVEIVKQYCEQEGRDPNELTFSYLSTLSLSDDPGRVQRHAQKHYIAGSVDDVTHELEQFAAVGVRHCMFRILDLPSLELFVQRVVPRFLS